MLMQPYEHRLALLRAELKSQGLDGFVVPICDEHMSEYVGDYAQRLAWLTGFGGSAGTAVVLADRAAIFIDGRYTEQVRDQVDGALFDHVAIAETKVKDWIAQHAPTGGRIGYDPWLHAHEWVAEVDKLLTPRGAAMVAVAANPLDAVWTDRPAPSPAPLIVQPDAFAGQSAKDKRDQVAQWLRAKGYDAVVIAALDSVAWTFNIRGDDIANTPVALSYAIIASDGSATLFVDPAKLTEEVRVHLGNGVATRGYGELTAALGELTGKTIAVDPERSVAAIFAALDAAGATIASERDPTILPKAIKNPVEQQGTRDAHIRDGVALTRFLKWCADELPKGGQDELSAAERLRGFRAEHPALVDLSFRTISATGPHGALPHYSVNADTNIPIETGHLYLVDSGGQYRDGTTDVTRVVAVGEPTGEMRKRYTQVLKGHIALAQAVFPEGTPGGALDCLARQYLWADGVDYNHGTGHGVGSFLSVHEGPQRIGMSAGVQSGTGEPLKPGMILSNEPGYYKAGAFGIRIENLVLVQPRSVDGGEKPMLGFETLTFAPLERALIALDQLRDDERAWVDAYHAEVLNKIGPHLDGDELGWLTDRCAPL